MQKFALDLDEFEQKKAKLGLKFPVRRGRRTLQIAKWTHIFAILFLWVKLRPLRGHILSLLLYSISQKKSRGLKNLKWSIEMGRDVDV